MLKANSESPAKDYEKKPLPGTTASNPPKKTPGPKARGADESDEAYAKRTANWQKSQERLKSVGITGGVNKASSEQLAAFKKEYGRDPSGLKPKDTTKPDMSAENPAKAKDKKEPLKEGPAGHKQQGVNNDTALGKAIVDKYGKQSSGKNTTAMKAAEKQMSAGNPRVARNRRRKKRLMQKASMQGGTY